ncbi:MAG: Rpp14/Pop5 family protein [Candidatus Bathyarchaeota archaeon]|nr:Rpp14/Pop5 family protein [Candidatus Bathyarchaeota archaeon]
MRRVKRRYLLLRFEVERVPGEREFLDAVWAAVGKLYGEFGASLTGLALISYDAAEKTAIVRVTLEALRMVRASLASITCIEGAEAAVHVMAVSGTIKSLHKRQQHLFSDV